MHSTLVRAQTVFGFFTTVAFCVAALIALSDFVSPQTPSADVKLRNVQVVRGRPNYYSTKKEEYAHIKFDLDTDLSTLFTWNTKQVFLYITATYPSLKPTEPPSSAIIWDAILASPSAPWHQNHYEAPGTPGTRKLDPEAQTPLAALGVLHLQNQRPKYQITDYTGKVANRSDVVLELGWNVQPWVGALTWRGWRDWGVWKGLKGGMTERFEFPGIKERMKVRKEDLGTAKGGEGNRGKPA
ncbi:Signal peptidase complex subunit [Coniosporium apollinis]|uniref:Signal peptidase subunit 3 n=1 Tax=Coniosporium apollinis TaxID=61459 RepID=A0ABQ9NJ50_9PEZI|nr:Signal peptidase complex subunit [Coniosporium apollinis]